MLRGHLPHSSRALGAVHALHGGRHHHLQWSPWSAPHSSHVHAHSLFQSPLHSSGQVYLPTAMSSSRWSSSTCCATRAGDGLHCLGGSRQLRAPTAATASSPAQTTTEPDEKASNTQQKDSTGESPGEPPDAQTPAAGRPSAKHAQQSARGTTGESLISHCQHRLPGKADPSSIHAAEPQSVLRTVRGNPPHWGQRQQPWLQQQHSPTVASHSSTPAVAEPHSSKTAATGPQPAVSLSPQQQAVVDAADVQHRALLAVAGSGKTEVLVQAALQGFRSGQNVLLLTKITSVTEEIKGRLHSYDPQIDLKREYSHWTHHGPSNSIGVANFDAMVHQNLMPFLHNAYLSKIGDQYKLKVRVLRDSLMKVQQRGAATPVLMKGRRPVDLLLIDEFQDLTKPQVNLVAMQKQLAPHMHTLVVGDVLQTLFDESVLDETTPASRTHSSSSSSSSGDSEQEQPQSYKLADTGRQLGVAGGAADPATREVPASGSALGSALQQWLQQPDVVRFDLDTCWRCPANHVELNNAVMLSHQVANQCNRLVAARPALPQATPFFFHHPPSVGPNANDHASITCRQVEHIISTYRKVAPDLRSEDIVVLSPRSNGHPVFLRLVASPEFVHFKTKDEVATHTINWGLSHGKIACLSVHGDKGRGHRLVIVLDASGSCLPHRSRVGRPEELVDVSALNVALTRSKEFLAVGFDAGHPSQYLQSLLSQQQGLSEELLQQEGTGSAVANFTPSSTAADGDVVMGTREELVPVSDSSMTATTLDNLKGSNNSNSGCSSSSNGSKGCSDGSSSMPRVWCSWHPHPPGSLAAELSKVQDAEFLPGTPQVPSAWVPPPILREVSGQALRNTIWASEHIAHDFESPGDILPQWRWYTMHQVKFGKQPPVWGGAAAQQVTSGDRNERAIVHGLMAELCVQRFLLWDPPQGRRAGDSQRAEDLLGVYRYLQYTSLHHYTANNKLLDLEADYHLNDHLREALNAWASSGAASSSKPTNSNATTNSSSNAVSAGSPQKQAGHAGGAGKVRRKTQPCNLKPEEVWLHVPAAALAEWHTKMIEVKVRLQGQLRDAEEKQHREQRQQQQQPVLLQPGWGTGTSLPGQPVTRRSSRTIAAAAVAQGVLSESPALNELRDALGVVQQLLVNPGSPRLLVHPLVSKKTFQADLKQFLSTKATTELEPSVMWRLALAKRQLHDRMRSPSAERLSNAVPAEELYHHLLANAAALVQLLDRQGAEQRVPAFRAWLGQQAAAADGSGSGSGGGDASGSTACGSISTKALLETEHGIHITLRKDSTAPAAVAAAAGSGMGDLPVLTDTGSSSSSQGIAGMGSSTRTEHYRVAGRSDIILEHRWQSKSSSSSSSSRSSGRSGSGGRRLGQQQSATAEGSKEAVASRSSLVATGQPTGGAGTAYRHLLELKCPSSVKDSCSAMWINQALAYALLSRTHIHQISVVDMQCGVLYTWTPVPMRSRNQSGQMPVAAAAVGAEVVAAGSSSGAALENVPDAWALPWAPISADHRWRAMLNIVRKSKWQDEQLLRALKAKVYQKADVADSADALGS